MLDFESLYQMYYMEVYSYVMTILRDAHRAEEITHETFLKALRAKDSYRGEASERTWLCAIAKNACTDFLRKRGRELPLVEDIPTESRIEAQLEDAASTLQIHRILHQLEEPYKEVFQLRVFGELSFRDIGAIFGKTENWSRVTYHRARLKIQERMGQNER